MKKRFINLFSLLSGIILIISAVSCNLSVKTDDSSESAEKIYTCAYCGKEYKTALEATTCYKSHDTSTTTIKYVNVTEIPAGTYTVYHFQQNTTGGKAFSDYTLFETEEEKAITTNAKLTDMQKSYECFTPKAMAQNETAVYIFYERDTITYTFNTGSEGTFYDNTTSRTISGLYGAAYSKPCNLSSDDYYFLKWDCNGSTAPTTFGTENLTFTAVWQSKSTPIDYSTCAIGDFILTDGRILSSGDFEEGIYDGKIAAVIIRVKDDTAPALGMGIYHGAGSWCIRTAEGYNTDVTGLQTITDGSTAWDILKEACSDAEEHPDYYPAWNYCLNYGTTQGFTGDLASGWYYPTRKEILCYFKYRTIIDSCLSKAGETLRDDDTCTHCIGVCNQNTNSATMNYYLCNEYNSSHTSSTNHIYNEVKSTNDSCYSVRKFE